MNIDIAPDLARKLISQQFPEYADLPITDVEKQGHDNCTYRLGRHIAKALKFYYLGRAKSAATAVTMLCGGAVSKRSNRNKIMSA